jgi:predicted RNA-binding protein with PUA-like domain
MACWLVKSEPETYAWADLAREGRTVWDGVRNNAAALHLKAMTVGDEVLFYHFRMLRTRPDGSWPWNWSPSARWPVR